ncbi:hypothetical protein EON65_42465 [archaeon]|nr:MAG: hypothetical protein EON65_42465 [archaeon]
MSSKDISETIKVFIRPRPQHINSTPTSTINDSSVNNADPTKLSGITSFERDNKSCVYYSAGTRTSKAYRAHRFFSPDIAQATVFSETAQPILDSVLQGFCGSILAYGATGSGKTFTMRGGEGEVRGVIPRYTYTYSSIYNCTHACSYPCTQTHTHTINIHTHIRAGLLSTC